LSGITAVLSLFVFSGGVRHRVSNVAANFSERSMNGKSEAIRQSRENVLRSSDKFLSSLIHRPTCYRRRRAAKVDKPGQQSILRP